VGEGLRAARALTPPPPPSPIPFMLFSRGLGRELEGRAGDRDHF